MILKLRRLSRQGQIDTCLFILGSAVSDLGQLLYDFVQ
jgi:hypothetical protein